MPARPPELRARPYVLSVPAGVPFLDAVADALLDGGLLPGLAPLRGDPLALADSLIFLPTRRAEAALREIIVAKLGGAALVPRILPLGRDDDDDDLFAEDGPETDAARTIGETERRLVLARLIRGWASAVAGAMKSAPGEADIIATSPGEAMSLAIALGRLIDSFETEGADWTRLAKLVPPEHDEVWKLTTGFLNIAAEFWPRHLEQEKLTGKAAATNAHLRALAKRLRETPPRTPVLVAGSTGSNPATAELMEAVACLPNGGVVLHGLDVSADDEAWAAIGGDKMSAQSWTHPQFFFHRLLKRLNVQRGEVGVLGREDRARDARRALASIALLPSDLTDRWKKQRMDPRALDGVSVVTAANEREEALTIAVILREALETPDRTAALITPDRALARRVAAELKRWGLDVEDSAGLPLADAGAGRLARLIAEVAAEDFAPQTLIALLHHPDARLGMGEDFRRAARALETAVLRGAAPPPGVDGLLIKLALEEAALPGERRFWHPAKLALGDGDWAAAKALIAALRTALGPLAAYGRAGAEAPLRDIVSAHRDAVLAVRAGAATGRDQDEVAAFLAEIADGASAGLGVRLADYPQLFKTMLRGRTTRREHAPGHRRLKILGTLEARLLGFDLTVLGGLNENIWPAQTENDPFLSRPMRAALGLPPPEWRIGLQAHDFEQALGGAEVVLTRALKAGGAPSVAARWVQRLEAVAGQKAWRAAVARGERHRALAARLDMPETQPPRLSGPLPRPPRDLRPDRLSVTEVETLIRDPYAIYARHVLRLAPLPRAGELPEASDRGTIIHDALAEFMQHHDAGAADAEEILIGIGRARFRPFWDFPDVRALWWPRFERVARWFIGWQRERAPSVQRTFTEIRGQIQWTTAAGRAFTLAGRADRIDALAGGYAVIDYKTGYPPSDKQVRAGFAPQLPLEAAMLARGGFRGVEGGAAVDYLYVRLSGQAEGGQARSVKTGDATPHEIAEDRFARFRQLVDIYEDETVPYRSHAAAESVRFIGDYDHLARHAEWSVAPETGEEENGDG